MILLVAGISNGSIAAFLIGAAFTAAAVVAWRQAKPTHKIFFGTTGGEQGVLESEDGDYVERVARAIAGGIGRTGTKKRDKGVVAGVTAEQKKSGVVVP